MKYSILGPREEGDKIIVFSIFLTKKYIYLILKY
jgi:hypothetical protein